MLTALLLAAQLTASTPDCTPVPLPPAILKHVHRKAHAGKPHAKRTLHGRRKAKRQPAPVVCRPVPPVLDFNAQLPPLDTLQPVWGDALADTDAPPPFTPEEAWPVTDDHYPPPYAPASFVAAGPPVMPHSVPEPGVLGLMGVAFVGLLWAIVDGRRHGR